MSFLKKIFNPDSIAVVGASDRKGRVGYDLFANIKQSEYCGKIFPVNNKRKKIQGEKAYNSIIDIDEKVDLAIIAVPAKFVPEIMMQCGEVGIKGVMIISAGFLEAGKQGNDLVKKIEKIAKKNKIRIIGPNCLGFINPQISLNASFASKNAQKGNVAFISQSGALCTSVLDWAAKEKLGFSYFISIGSMLDVSFGEIIDYLSNDKNTKVICLYMESLTKANDFLKIAKKVAKKKPIVVLKVGKSDAGSKAAQSHTGTFTGNDQVFELAFRETGIIRVADIRELFNAAKIFSNFKKNLKNRLAIITNAGGPGVIASDALSEVDFDVVQLKKKTIANLNKILPISWSHGNPIDVLGDADSERYKKVIGSILLDNSVDTILVILTPQSMTNPLKIAEDIVELSQKNFKKNIVCSFIGGMDVAKGIEILQKNKLLNFETPSEAVMALSYVKKFYQNKKINKKISNINGKNIQYNKKYAQEIIEKVKIENRFNLNEYEAKEILNCYGIGSAQHFVAHNKKEAIQFFKKLKSSQKNSNNKKCAMKIMSSDILHKVDIGGVVLNVDSARSAKQNFEKIIKNVQKHNPKVIIDGVLMEEMLEVKYEVLLGVKKDDIFGHVLIFGAGGTFVELIDDINLALLSFFDRNKAFELIKKTNIFKILNGYRNGFEVNIDKLLDLIINFSMFVKDFPQIKEIDINPLLINEKGFFCVDAKIILK